MIRFHLWDKLWYIIAVFINILIYFLFLDFVI